MTQGSLQAYSSGTVNFHLAHPHEVSQDTAKLQGRVMYVDPAGGGKNGDETGYAITGFLNGNIYWLASGGIPGGYGVEGMTHLALKAALWQVNTVIIEKNMGYGAFREVWLPILRKEHPVASVEDDLVTGQKELRIIETLEPIIARGSLIINEDIVRADAEYCERHEPAKRALYSVFHQMSKITRDRNCLFHDDRLDALEGACRFWVKMLAIDQQKAVEAQRTRELREALKDPMGYGRYDPPKRFGGSLFNKYRR
jgi:hypothetical protein